MKAAAVPLGACALVEQRAGGKPLIESARGVSYTQIRGADV